MARRRRPPEPEAPTRDGTEVAITSHDRLDPRVFLIVPTAIALDPEAVLAWALRHAPGCVRDDDEAASQAVSRARAAERRPRPTPRYGR